MLAQASSGGARVLTAPYPAALGDGHDSSPCVQLDISRLDRVLEHDVADQVVHVEAGIKIAELNRLLAAKRQMLPLSLPADWTLVDAVLTGESGDLEHGYGGIRDLVLGMSAALADGTAITCGGRVLKNVSGYDVTRLLIGSQGWLAVPTSITLRLYAVPEVSLTLAWSFASLREAMRFAGHLRHSGLPFAALEMMPAQIIGGAEDRFVIVVRILTLAKVCQEVSAAACRLGGQPEVRMEGEKSDEFWRRLQEDFAGSKRALKVVAKTADLLTIAEALPSSALWCARPAKGRLIASCAAAEATLAALTKLTGKMAAPIVVAGPDKQYHYLVRRLPENDEPVRRLKQSIKQALDPANTLNPYVLP